jgi:hypothetical protein
MDSITIRDVQVCFLLLCSSSSHGRLNDWGADEKGYFTEEGLDYELNAEGNRKNTPRLADSAR